MHRNRLIIGLLTGMALLVTLLTGCGQGTNNVPVTAAATPTATTQPTATMAPTVTPFFVNGIAYQRVTDSMFGFSFNLPADMQLNLQEAVSQSGGDHVIWMSADQNAQTAFEVDFGGATTGYSANQCPSAIPGATVVTVGAGITGYQVNALTIGQTSSGVAGVRKIVVSFVSNGVVVGIRLIPYTQGTADELMARYSPFLQEMLASFKSGTVVNPSPPCGS